jgi:hypothetical protein
MKKLLVTTLVAVAFAAVNTVDAKMMKKADAPTTANEIAVAVQTAAINPSKENVAEVKDMLVSEDDKDKQMMNELVAKQAKLRTDIENQKQLKAKLPHIGGITGPKTEEYKRAHNEVAAELNRLNEELTITNNRIAKMTPSVGKSYVLMATAAVALLATAGVIAYDLYYGKGYTASAVASTRAAAASAYERSKGLASSTYDAGSGLVSGAAETTRSTYKKIAPRFLGGE